jgi:protein-tyrosine phosphatase
VSLKILFVCMGNICRSPTAEAVMRSMTQRAVPRMALEIDSAGTHGYHVGEPPDERSQRIAAAHGIDMSPLRARLLVPADFARFDRILVMDRTNLAEAHRLAPATAPCRPELLLDVLPAQALREVPDPYGGGPRQFENVFRLIEQAAGALLGQLRASQPVSVSH